MVGSHGDILFKLHRLVLLSGRVFCSNVEKNSLTPQRNLTLPISFPWHKQNIFCVVISKAPAETIHCVTEYATSDILQLYFVSNFMPQFLITLWSLWLLLNTEKECTIKRPAEKTFLIIWTAINKPYPRVLKRSGNFSYVELVCLTSREIWETAHDNAFSMMVETQAPLWQQSYHPLSLKMSNALNCNSLWTCSNSFISVGLANGRECFSVKFLYSNPGRVTFSQLPYKKNGTLRV